MRSGGPLRSDPVKAREWQRRSAQQAMERARTRPREPRKRTSTKRRNDAPWRNECIDLYGDWCRECGRTGTQMDHMKPRSQGGRSVVENGLPLCRSHHEAKTAGMLRIRPEWLTSTQVDWLASEGWVRWQADGQPHGEGWRHFEPYRWADAEQEGGHDGHED